MNCHGNIRARNIMVMECKKGLLRVKLCDPGLIYVYSKHRDKLDASENAERYVLCMFVCVCVRACMCVCVSFCVMCA